MINLASFFNNKIPAGLLILCQNIRDKNYLEKTKLCNIKILL